MSEKDRYDFSLACAYIQGAIEGDACKESQEGVFLGKAGHVM
jgi:hypothetical protein